ncbi:MAG: ribonuclease H-like domain-containing protein [Armatimonadota bacterium]|nr:ribonuclease H-like domain-containing protein [Fimbriimonadaceae bacterium]
MLTRSFCHLPRVGPSTEADLWRQGCTSWDAFLADPKGFNLRGCDPVEAEDIILASREALAAGDFRFFARHFSKEVWRTWPAFADQAVYLDIETDGGQSGSSITVIGLYDDVGFRGLVKGKDLHDFPDLMEQYGMIVTFFGTGFDIPMLKRGFPRVPFDQIHLDLCMAFKRLGIRGGLKKIEKRFGLERGDDTDGLDGRDAIRLWYAAQRGREDALETLLAYNREDVANLKILAGIAYKQLESELLGPHLSGNLFDPVNRQG